MKTPKYMKMLSAAQELVELNTKLGLTGANGPGSIRFQELFNDSVKFAEAYLEAVRVISVVASNIASSPVHVEKESKAVGNALVRLDDMILTRVALLEKLCN